MIKLNIGILIMCLLINNNMMAKNNLYYYLDNRECNIVIPIDFYIQENFTKNRIAFIREKNLKTSNIVIINENQKKYTKWLKEVEEHKHNTLVEEKKIGHLVYQKFKIPITQNIFEYRHNIFGNNFFWGSNNVNQKDIDYMIKHCIATYKNPKKLREKIKE